MVAMETLDRAHRAGQQRLYPSIADPSWLILRRRREIFRRWMEGLPPGLSVLDIGGRIQPYRSLLAAKCAKYTALDLAWTPLVSVIGQAERLPLADGQFDLVLCTQVLEYIPEPRSAIDEIHRVLKAGGTLFLSAPAVYPRGAEIEYWRFLPCALKRMLASFSEVDVTPEGNSLVGLVRTLNVCLVTLAPGVLARLLRYTLVPCLNLLGALVEPVFPGGDDRFSANYSVRARK